ncbi:MAG: peptidase and in, kexin, sedolisin [Actinomycetia bacterium]|nr:peptidase and in, kexin, sedolisin [Actinomycetes bacterium]
MMPRTRGLAAAAVAALLVGGATTALASPSLDVATAAHPAGLTRLLATDAPGVATGIATFDAVPGAATTAALRGLGLTVQPMEHLPLALVRGPVAALTAAVDTGAANDVYPNDRLHYLDTASSNAMGGAATRAAGFTGKGVTVGIVDSGCDATHPDLKDHVVHNVKLIGAEYANVTPDSGNTIVVANETGPYQNTDIGSGHGTHVAGIIAADGTTDPSHLGVAPDAELVCYSIGEVLFTTAVVSAYDHMLDQPDLWGIDVVNNSWGNSYQQYEPRNPVAVATKAVADQGVTVVFAAGNAGSGNGEASLNPFSQYPWVISVAAGTIGHQRGDFSSNGFRYDNSQPVNIGPGGHTTFTGNRIGVVHPDVTGPGVDISSTCDSAGTLVGPCGPGENTSASGTSMASPHVAGAAAVLLQAHPSLTPDQVREAMQVTATPVKGTQGEAGPAKELGFWQVGYGYVDLAAAVQLVQSPNVADQLKVKQAAADRRVLKSTGYAVRQSDLWTYDAPRASLGGSDSHTYAVTVSRATTHLKVTLSHPSLNQVGVNGFEYVVTVRDAAGRIVATTTEADGVGTSSAFVDLRPLRTPSVTYGAFTVEVSGQSSLSDPDSLDSDSVLGDTITLQLAQLVPLT